MFKKNKRNKSYKHLIFDFDGVIAETNSIRFEGFRLLFKNYPEKMVDRVVRYAKLNGGKSRYDKIKYFFETALNKSITDDKVRGLALQYSGLVKQKVIEAPYVKGSIEFLCQHEKKYDFAIASGSDQQELREVCRVREIDHYFVEILGSPVTKEEIISQLLLKMEWKNDSCLYIGDTQNDWEASKANGIDFIGRQSGLVNWELEKDVVFIDDISQLHFHLK